ncbi:transposase [Methanomethylovorans sp.]|uniref:transposase n=1 Tax=Methanomethylovorans sp. TaxID=2758717 RepID=UPI00351C2971
MEFRELSDEQWKFIKPFLPPQPITGRKRADDRKVINGIIFVLITGCRWADMPQCYGSRATAWRRLKWWSEEGIWYEIMESLRDSTYQDSKFSMDIVCVDSSFVETKKGEKIRHTMDTRKRKV